MKKLSKFQISVLFRLREGYELRINISKEQFSPKLVKAACNSEAATMLTINTLRRKGLIRDSDKYNPPYHYYIITDEGTRVTEELKKTITEK